MSDCLTDTDLHRLHARELDEAAEARIREHLAECEQCARRDSGLVAEITISADYATQRGRVGPYQRDDGFLSPDVSRHRAVRDRLGHHEGD